MTTKPGRHRPVQIPCIVVVVPCYNEERRLDAARLLTLLDDRRQQILFVDDGSTDGTRELLLGLFGTEPRVEVMSLGTNRGKGEAVRFGMRKAIENGAQIVAYLDADLASPPSELRRVLDRLEQSDDLAAALGSRVRLLGCNIDRFPARHFQGRIFATIASIMLGISVYDTQCGLKCFRTTDALREAISTPFRSRWVFDVELLGRLVSCRNPLRPEAIVEVPLLEWQDIGGSRLGLRAKVRSLVDLLFIVGPQSRTLWPNRSPTRGSQ